MGPRKPRSWSPRLPAGNKLVLLKFHLEIFICLSRIFVVACRIFGAA